MRFSVGHEVEVSWDDEGFRGAWYEAKVLRTMPKARRYRVVYDHILADDADSDTTPAPLRETADHAHVRPRPPRHGGPFQTHHPVDAWHNDGWWTGVVAAGDEGEHYTVRFPNSREQMEFAAADLRAHLEWVRDEWVHPDVNSPGSVALAFPIGTRVEVARQTGNSLLMWFVATVEKHIWENNLLVQYESLRVDVGKEFLREIVDARHVRPCPPLIRKVGKFRILDDVEVFHNDGWCVGVISRIHSRSEYSVISDYWEGGMKFCRSNLRPWHEWTNGSWVHSHKVNCIKSQNLHQAKSVRHSQGFHAKNGARKSGGLVCVSISSDSPGNTTSSDTEVENGSTFGGLIGLSLGYQNPVELDTVDNDAWMLDSLIMARANTTPAQTGREFLIATPALPERRKFHIMCSSMVQQSRFKIHSEQTTADSLNLDVSSGENELLESDNLEHQSGGQSFHSSACYEMKDAHHHVKWAHKRARSSRMNSPSQRSKHVTCRPKHALNVHNVVRSGQHTMKKRRGRGRPLKAKSLNAEASLTEELHGGDSLDICQDGIQLADKVGVEPSQENILLLTLDPAVEVTPSHEELAVQELHGGDPVDICQDGIQLADKVGVEPSQENIFLLTLDPAVEVTPSHEELAVQELHGGDRLDICQDGIQLAEKVGVEPSQENILLLTLDPAVEVTPSLEELAVQELHGGDPLDICQEGIQLADDEGVEPSEENTLLLTLDPAVEVIPSHEELAAQELDVTMPPVTRLNETSEDVIQINEVARVKQNESLYASLGDCESCRVIDEDTGVNDAIPCGCPSKFGIPFVKSSAMWEVIEATEVFRVMPQKPHFCPLLQYCKELREGMAIGLMVTFDNFVTNTYKLRITDPKDTFEEMLKMASYLEGYGFDVQHVRDRLEKLVKIKHNKKQHEEKRIALQGLILKRQNEGQKFIDEMKMIDRSVAELDEAMINFRDRRSTLIEQRETNDHEIVKLQIDEKVAMQSYLSAEHEFDSTLSTW